MRGTLVRHTGPGTEATRNAEQVELRRIVEGLADDDLEAVNRRHGQVSATL
jgi:hypothetical protein